MKGLRLMCRINGGGCDDNDHDPIKRSSQVGKERGSS